MGSNGVEAAINVIFICIFIIASGIFTAVYKWRLVGRGSRLKLHRYLIGLLISFIIYSLLHYSFFGFYIWSLK